MKLINNFTLNYSHFPIIIVIIIIIYFKNYNYIFEKEKLNAKAFYKS